MSTPSRTPGAERPLSPFMIGPYYKPQLTSMMSITHRLTGLFNTFGAVLLAAWLIALAAGPAAFNLVAVHVGAWYGQLVLLFWTWSMLYHLCNGIRHLLWDTGRGFSIEAAYRSGYTVIAVSLVLTAIVWAVALL